MHGDSHAGRPIHCRMYDIIVLEIDRSHKMVYELFIIIYTEFMGNDIIWYTSIVDNNWLQCMLKYT